MDNPKRGDSSFTADGKEYTLRYSTEALILLEEDQNRGLLKVLREVESWTKNPENIRLGLVRSLLWAGLQDHHPELTKKQAGELIEAVGGLITILTPINLAFERAFSAPGTKGTNPPQTTNGTGMVSSLNTPVMDTSRMISGDILPGN